MPVARLLTDEQHGRLYDIYMREARSPSECVSHGLGDRGAAVSEAGWAKFNPENASRNRNFYNPENQETPTP